MNKHLISRIPNNFITRWVIGFLNKQMKRSNSKYRLRIRYRVPKRDLHYGFGGALRQCDAKKFSIYSREV